MKYNSCTTSQKDVSFEDAVLLGWAEGNGMFLPAFVPAVDIHTLRSWIDFDYKQLVKTILRYFISEDEIDEDNWNKLIDDICYQDFLNPIITYDETPIIISDDGSTENTVHIVDLARGPSLAFKDFGMQCLCAIMDFFLKRKAKKLTIIVGTSGDTGPSAMIAVKNKPNMNLIVLYPLNRISREQEVQMLSFDESIPNAKCFAVEGTSDDLDVPIETLFKDTHFKSTYGIGSVNSVNILRFLAQIVHFFHIYLHSLRCNTNATAAASSSIPSQSASNLTISIPSGAAGQLTACIYAKLMGVPIANIIVATNSNDILFNFFVNFQLSSTKNIPVKHTLANAMDIGVPYNLERVIFLATKGDTIRTRYYMDVLRGNETTLSHLELGTDMKQWIVSMGITAYSVPDESIQEMIRHTHYIARNVQDPHTSVGLFAAKQFIINQSSLNIGDKSNVYCIKCANPIKFMDIVSAALSSDIGANEAKQLIVKDNYHAAELADRMEGLIGLRSRSRMRFVNGENWVDRLKVEVIHF